MIRRLCDSPWNWNLKLIFWLGQAHLLTVHAFSPRVNTVLLFPGLTCHPLARLSFFKFNPRKILNHKIEHNNSGLVWSSLVKPGIVSEASKVLQKRWHYLRWQQPY